MALSISSLMAIEWVDKNWPSSPYHDEAMIPYGLILFMWCLFCSLLLLITSLRYRKKNEFRAWARRAVILGFLPAILFCYQIYASINPRPEPTQWDGWVFNSQYDAEGNFSKVGAFESKELCIEAAIQEAPSKVIQLSNYPDKGALKADSIMCGRGCRAPDGPGDITIWEYRCLESVNRPL